MQEGSFLFLEDTAPGSFTFLEWTLIECSELTCYGTIQVVQGEKRVVT